MTHPKKIITNYDEFYTSCDWDYPEESIGVARVHLYFEIGGIYLPLLWKRPLRVLDVGCGTGFYTHCLNTYGLDADGLDSSLVAITKARTRWSGAYEFHHGDANNLDSFQGQYDVIFARGLSLYNTCDRNVVARLTDYYLSLIRKPGAVIMISSSDLSGTNPGWVNCPYAQLNDLFSNVEGRIFGPFFFDYWLTPIFLTRRFPGLGRLYLQCIRQRLSTQLLALVARRLKARIPFLFIAATE